MRGFFHLFVCILFTLGLSACKQDAGFLTLPDDLDKNYSLAYTDTITLATSTVLLDSIPTSNTGALLFGKYQDPKLGVVEAKAFFQVGPATRWYFNLDNNFTYESASLIMQTSGYYYGDTTKAQTIEVRQIEEDFKSYNLSRFWIEENLYSYFSKDKNKLYNNSELKINESEILGSTTFKVGKALKDSIVVKLNDDLGLSWFQQAKESSIHFQSTGNFVNYFKGLAIVSLNESNIISIVSQRKVTNPAATFTTKVRIYYMEGSVHKFFDFPIFGGFVDPSGHYNPDNSYSKIQSDWSGTLLQNLSHENAEIPSALTDDETYLQAGVGLVTKIKFPSLRELVNIPGFLKVNSARLVIEPIKGSFGSDYFLPTKVNLFYGKGNLPLDRIPADFKSTPQEAQISINQETGTTSGYAFSVTQYIQQLVSNTNGNINNVSLMVSLPPEYMGATVTRAVIGNGKRANFRARLEIYYLKQNE